MTIGDIVVSDNRYLAIGAESKNPTYTDTSDGLLSCQSRIMFEIIESEYAFGEQGKKSAVSNHYTWKVEARFRVDDVLAGVIRNALPSPLGSSDGTGKFALKFAENGSTASQTNPVYSGTATVGDVSTLIADNDSPATERIVNLTFNGSGNLSSATT